MIIFSGMLMIMFYNVSLFMIAFLLIAAHAAFDYAWQGDTVAVNKNPNANTPLQKFVPWYYWLGSHALMHGAAAAVITNSVTLGVAETVAHFLLIGANVSINIRFMEIKLCTCYAN